MGLFYKSKTVTEVADEFPKQYAFLKLFVFEAWSKTVVPDKPLDELTEGEVDMITYIGQVIQYLFAEDPSDYGDATPIQIKRINKIREIIPEKSREAMANNKDMHRIVVYTLRMKLYLSTMYHGADWIHTPEGKRVTNILTIYGGEFPEEVTDKKFHQLLTRSARAYEVMKKRG